MRSDSRPKRRGFTIRDDNRRTTPEERARRMREHKRSRSEMGDQKSGLVKDRLVTQLGPGRYGELLRRLKEMSSACKSLLARL